MTESILDREGKANLPTQRGTAVPAARTQPESRQVLGVRVDATSYTEAAEQIVDWGQQGGSHYVCVANVHGVIESQDSEDFKAIMNSADLVTPDGMPLVWALKLLGVKDATRVYGPTLTLHICERAAVQGVPVFLYGGTPESLVAFEDFLKARYPSLKVAGAIAPPFRPLTDDEDREYTRQIAESGAGIVFVGIGCPKQEKWMAAHKGRINGVMIGIGAAFDFHSGRVKQAPDWLSNNGLEWAFRLAVEPKRLWKRYLGTVPRFAISFGKQLIDHQFGRKRA